MRILRGRWHGLALALMVLLIAVPSLASGATSVRALAPSHYLVIHPALAPAPPVTIGANVRVYRGVAPGYPAGGVQGTSPGLEGTTVVLASCAAACTDNYRPASAPALPGGHYLERVTFTVVQPRHAGPATGFDLEVAVLLSTGWVVGKGYFSTGVATGATTATLTLRLFIDLGTAIPTITKVEVTVNPCGSTTTCP